MTLPVQNLKRMWDWLQRVSPAKTYHSLDRVPDLPEIVRGCSGILYEPFAWWDGQSCCWRTWQRCLIEEWEVYSEPWPRSGMTRNGIAYRLPTLEPGIRGTESGFMPTPATSDHKGCSKNRYYGSETYRSNYREFLRSGQDDAIYPNPRLTEQVMGYAIDYTHLETQ